jgi:hypothetical protein
MQAYSPTRPHDDADVSSAPYSPTSVPWSPDGERWDVESGWESDEDA